MLRRPFLALALLPRSFAPTCLCVWLLGIAGVLVGGWAGRAWAQLASTPWPMFQHDPQHTGRSPFLGPQVPHLQWAFATGDSFSHRNGPVIGSDGTLYV